MRFVGRNLVVVLAVACACVVAGPTAAFADVVYWSEYTSGFGAVYKMDVSTGVVSPLIIGTGYGPGGNHIDDPVALAVDKAGNVYVGSANNGDIVKVTPQGVASDYFAVNDPTHYSHTYGLTFDPGGSLYAAQYAQNAVAKLPPGGGSQTLFATGLNKPQGGVSDSLGNIYVYTGTITADGETVTKITPQGVASTFLSVVTGIAFDSADTLYTGVSGTITVTPAGGDASTLATGLTRPFPIALGEHGDLYVYDGGRNDELLKVSPTGVVSSFGHLPYALSLAVDVPEPMAFPALSVAVTVLFRPSRLRRARRAKPAAAVGPQPSRSSTEFQRVLKCAPSPAN